MSPAPAQGLRLGPYELLACIGKGGMGEVWKARDIRLDREVAVKLSAGQFTDRFEREARAIAALNHPNICTLFDVGHNYLVMELIDGPTLAERIGEGPIPIDTSLAIAKQIAAALDAAHRKNIVHRDLKPGNIKVCPDGSVKVLDFGLAKSGASGMPLNDDSPTMAMSTQVGVILGTASYMAPEQAKGKSVDKRADIWAFGVVLYEMLTAKRAFEGDSITEILGAVIHKQPDLSKIPPQARRLVERCLDKDPASRLGDLAGWEHLLDSEALPVALSPGSDAPHNAPRKTPDRTSIRKVAMWAIPAVLILAIGIWALSFRSAPPLRATRFQVEIPENVYFSSYVSVSPDGQNLLFNAAGDQSGLWIHNLATLQWRRLTGTDNAGQPFWSPDSRSVAFETHEWDGTRVRKIDIAGGMPATVYTIKDRLSGGGSWGPGGDFLIGGQFGGGTVWRYFPTEEVRGLRHLRRTGQNALTQTRFFCRMENIFSTSLQDPRASKEFTQVRSRQNRRASLTSALLPVRTSPVTWDGRLLYMRDGALLAQSFNADRLRVSGSPAQLAEHVETIYSVGIFSASEGVLAYRSGTATPGYLLTWVDRRGKEIGTFGQPNFDGGVRFSPDGTLAATTGIGSDRDRTDTIWVLDFARGIRTRFTLSGPAESPVWSPDGSQIFYSSGAKRETISVKPASGVGDGQELLSEAGRYHYPSGISPDGRFLLYYTMPKPQGPGVSGETWALPLRPAGPPVHLLGGRFSENRAVISPDGRWIAYRSNESGQFEVYIRNVVTSGNNLSLGEEKWQASKGTVAADLPVWRHDSKELFYMSDQNVVFSVGLQSGSGAAGIGGLRLSSPEALFTRPCACAFDVSADGQRFLVRGANGADSRAPITVVLNWQADLKKPN